VLNPLIIGEVHMFRVIAIFRGILVVGVDEGITEIVVGAVESPVGEVIVVGEVLGVTVVVDH
jgi:hypothetical protein